MLTKSHRNISKILGYFQVFEGLPQKFLEYCEVVAILSENRLDRRVTHEDGDVNANGGCHTGDVYFRFRFTMNNEPIYYQFNLKSDFQVLYNSDTRISALSTEPHSADRGASPKIRS